MRVEKGDIWELYDKGYSIVVTTNIGWNPVTMRNNMGAGTVLEASLRFDGLSKWYGEQCKAMVKRGKIRVIHRPDLRLFFFPVKPLLDPKNPEISWNQKASIPLIREMLFDLKLRIAGHGPVAMTFPGCGNGGLPVGPVRRRMRDIIGDAVLVCDLAA